MSACRKETHELLDNSVYLFLTLRLSPKPTRYLILDSRGTKTTLMMLKPTEYRTYVGISVTFSLTQIN